MCPVPKRIRGPRELQFFQWLLAYVICSLPVSWAALLSLCPQSEAFQWSWK